MRWFSEDGQPEGSFLYVSSFFIYTLVYNRRLVSTANFICTKQATMFRGLIGQAITVASLVITGCWHLPSFYLSRPIFNPTSFFFWLKQGMPRALRRAISVYRQLECLHFNLVRLFRLYRRGWFPSHDYSHWMQGTPAIQSLSVKHKLFRLQMHMPQPS